MEDIDPPREVKGAADDILRTLEGFGFEWDEPVMYQSQRRTAYKAALEELRQRELVYACSCSRKSLAAANKTSAGPLIYPGTCRHGPTHKRSHYAIRVRTQHAGVIGFDDAIQTRRINQDLQTEVGDFVVRRADGVYAYQLGVVVDDAAQRISHVVRGVDLMASTPRQIYLQRLLGYGQPGYAHLPLATHPDGEKLSKQTHAAAIRVNQAPHLLVGSLRFLGQDPPAALAAADLATIWDWAIGHWRMAAVPKRLKVAVDQGLPPSMTGQNRF